MLEEIVYRSNANVDVARKPLFISSSPNIASISKPWILSTVFALVRAPVKSTPGVQKRIASTTKIISSRRPTCLNNAQDDVKEKLMRCDSRNIVPGFLVQKSGNGIFLLHFSFPSGCAMLNYCLEPSTQGNMKVPLQRGYQTKQSKLVIIRDCHAQVLVTAGNVQKVQ